MVTEEGSKLLGQLKQELSETNACRQWFRISCLYIQLMIAQELSFLFLFL